jgi:two-component system, NtrC family, response regulator AtoC
MPRATILVVDDEALIRWSLSERLQSDGYEVLEADTGKAALEKLSEGVDLVLLDYRLPDTDGVSILRKVKEFDQDVLVILLTAYASVETAVEAMKLGAYHFANKPFDLDEVSTTVERALEGFGGTGRAPRGHMGCNAWSAVLRRSLPCVIWWRASQAARRQRSC